MSEPEVVRGIIWSDHCQSDYISWKHNTNDNQGLYDKHGIG